MEFQTIQNPGEKEQTIILNNSKDLQLKDKGFNTYFKKETINRKYLGYDLLDDYKEYNNIIIQADTGSGKTSTLKKYLKKNNLKFIALVSRITLAEELNRVFDDDEVENQIYNIEELDDNISTIVQLESIEKIFKIIELDDMKDYVIFIDEIYSFIHHLFLSPTVRQIHSIRHYYKMLKIILMRSKQNIFVDASVNERVFNFVNNITEEKVFFIENLYMNNVNKKATELENLETLLLKIKKCKSFTVCCDSAANAKMLYEKLGGDESGIKLIVAEKNEKGHEKKFIMDLHYKLIYSPKIIYGLDASKYERTVFCYYSGCSINSEMMYQQLNRVRKIKEVFFYFERKAKQTKIYKTLEDVKKRTECCEKWKNVIIELEPPTKIDLDIIEVKEIITLQEEKINANKYLSFVDILKNKGFVVHCIKTESKPKRKTKKDKALSKEYDRRNFNYENNLKNEFLKLPKDVAYENMELLLDDYEYIKHNNIVFFMDESITFDIIKDKLYTMLKNDLSVDVITSKLNKYNLLLRIIKKTKSNKSNITINEEEINPVSKKDIVDEYTLLNPRSTKTIKTKNIINKITQLLITELFPKNVYNVKRTRQKKNNKIINEIYNYEMDKNIYNHHFKLSQYKYIKQNHEEDDFNDGDEEVEFIDEDPQ